MSIGLVGSTMVRFVSVELLLGMTAGSISRWERLLEKSSSRPPPNSIFSEIFDIRIDYGSGKNQWNRPTSIRNRNLKRFDCPPTTLQLQLYISLEICMEINYCSPLPVVLMLYLKRCDCWNTTICNRNFVTTITSSSHIKSHPNMARRSISCARRSKVWQRPQKGHS